MTLCDDVVDLFMDESSQTERLKLLVLYSGEMEDRKLVRAATGALAILTEREKICQQITTYKSSMDILKHLLVVDDAEIQHRAVFIVANMLESSKEVAEVIISGDFFEIFLALMTTTEKDKTAIREHAERGLKAAQKWGIIKENK